MALNFYKSVLMAHSNEWLFQFKEVKWNVDRVIPFFYDKMTPSRRVSYHYDCLARMQQNFF